MPFPVAAAVAGAGLLGQGINAVSQGSMNKKTRQWNEKMYDRQQADNFKNWELQNSFNSPEAQMARLQKAGLNPNLVYGNGATATSSSAPDTPHAMPYKPEAPRFDVPQIADSYFNIQSQQQTLSNQQKQGDILSIQAKLGEADLWKKLFENTYANDTLHIRRGYDADRTNQQHYKYALDMQKHELNTQLNDLILNNASLRNQAIDLDNKGRTQNYDINSIRKQLSKKDLDFYGHGKAADIGVNLLRLIFKK